MRLLSVLNRSVAQKSTHKAFNSRRLHLLGIVRWTLHLLLEASELYSLGEIAAPHLKRESENDANSTSRINRVEPMTGVSPMAMAAYDNGWYCQAPSVESTSVGGDPDNPLLAGM
jgi:hypothetical protein